MYLKVKYHNVLVGILFLDSKKGQIYFEYDNKFADSPFQLSPLLMPNKKSFVYNFNHLPADTFHFLPPLFADSLPDKFGNEVFKKWLSAKGKTFDNLNPLEKLSYVGKRATGALEYFPDIDLSRKRGFIDVSDIVSIADAVLNNKKNSVSDFNRLNDILLIGTSAGGARAKAVIAIHKITKKIIPGDILSSDLNYDYYLFKIDQSTKDDLKFYGKIEYAYYKMAKLAGIDMSDSYISPDNIRAHFFTKRFDRINGEKIHMQTLCNIAGMDYKNPLSHSYESVFNTIQKLNCDFSDKEEMFRRCVFNVVSQNNDDHTKNISFLMDNFGKWRLSPAYDITYSYNENNLWLKQHQLSVNGKRKKINSNDLLKLGKNFGIRNRKTIIERVVEAVSQWKKIALDVDIPKHKISSVEKNLLFDNFSKEIKHKHKI